MGLLISRAMDLLIGKQDRRILMLGTGTVGRPITAVLLIGCPCCYKLDAAGKTTILYSLHLGERITTIPTIGFNVEVCEYKSLRLTMWDVGGQERLRRLWRHYFDNTDALIFVVDASDRPRFEEAKQELMSLLSEEQLADAAVLIYCNKVDLPGTASASELVQTLEVDKLAGRHRAWYVQASCAATGEGLYEGLDWLSRQFKNRTQNGSRH